VGLFLLGVFFSPTKIAGGGGGGGGGGTSGQATYMCVCVVLRWYFLLHSLLLCQYFVRIALIFRLHCTVLLNSFLLYRTAGGR
jgi:hypothetical protein